MGQLHIMPPMTASNEPGASLAEQNVSSLSNRVDQCCASFKARLDTIVLISLATADNLSVPAPFARAC